MKKLLTISIIGIVLLTGIIFSQKEIQAQGTDWSNITIKGVTRSLTDYKVEKGKQVNKMATHLDTGKGIGINEFQEWVEYFNTEKARCGLSDAFKNDWNVQAGQLTNEIVTRANAFIGKGCQ